MTVTGPKGFLAAGVAAGLKTSGNTDMALVVNQGPTYDSASVFTANRCKANPVLWSQEVVKDGVVRAVVLNSGGANCYTGAEGFQITHATAERVAERLGIGAGDVVVCSTGLIGMLNDRDRLLDGVDALATSLVGEGGGGGDAAAHAIMTTDTVAKQVFVQGPPTGSGTGSWSIGGMAKGAGMLAPALATMLVVLTTDAVVPADELDRALRAATRASFDRLDSDGCMSTNDTVTVMASGASGVTPAPEEFAAKLTEACQDLAVQLLDDAEGADHSIHITVRNAASEEDALEVGRAVARGNLFKAAIFGKDPNWGRILADVGTTKAAFDPTDLDVALNDVWVCRNSAPGEDRSLVDLNERKVTVTIDLKAGEAKATVLTNDLTHAYVHENSAYSS